MIAIGLGLTGIGLLAVLGAELLSQPWLLVALTIYAINLLVAAFISRPNLRRLLRLGAGESGRPGTGARGSSATWRTAWPPRPASSAS